MTLKRMRSVWCLSILLLLVVYAVCDRPVAMVSLETQDTETQTAFFWYLILGAISFIAGELLKGKQKIENARPSGLGDFNFATAVEDRAVPIVWGTVKLSGPNTLWHGDLEQRPITEKVKTSLFSSKRIITGYKNYLGVQFGLCLGPIGSLRRIWVGEKELWSGEVTADAATITIDAPNFLGGNDLGAGGLKGTLRLNTGSTTQVASSYMTTHQTVDGGVPALRGTAYLMAEHFYFGDSTSIQPWAFEIRRIPNGLGLSFGDTSLNGGNDANPMNVLYELITNTKWGLGKNESSIDLANFNTAAETLADEGNGISMILDNARPVNELIREIERQIDGVLYVDLTTNKYRIALARGGYTVGDLQLLDESNCIGAPSFARGTWEDTVNFMLVRFDNRANDYAGAYAAGNDPSNVRKQARVVADEVQYPGVKDADLANQLAWRDLRAKTFPVARVQVSMNRTAYDVFPGKLYRFSNARLEIEDMPVRVIRCDTGTLTDGSISMFLVEDIFVYDIGVFAPPGATNWTPPDYAVSAIPTEDSLVFEAPKAFIDRDTVNVGVLDQIWVGGEKQDLSTISIDVMSEIGSSYSLAGEVGSFAFSGELANALTHAGTQGNITINIDPTDLAVSDMLEEMSTDLSVEDVGAGLANLVLIDNEFFVFRQAAVSSGELVLSNGFRGVLDSTQAAHSAGTKVWILVGNLLTRTFESGSSYNLKLLPRSAEEVLVAGSAPVIAVSMNDRARRPYPAVGLTVNGSTFVTSTADFDAGSGIDGRGITVGWIRRDFRTTNEADAVSNESTLPTDFPSANSTEYAVEVRNDPNGTNTLLFTTGWGQPTMLLSRPRILRFTAGALPSRLRTTVVTRHTYEGSTLEALRTIVFDFDVASTALSGAFNFGVLGNSVTSGTYVAASTASHSISIGTALASGDVEYRLNGGAWTTAIASGGTAGSFAATIGDDIEIRHTQSGSTDSETLCVLFIGGTTLGYAVFTY